MPDHYITSGKRIADYLRQQGKPLSLLRKVKPSIDALEHIFNHQFQTTTAHRGWQFQFVKWVIKLSAAVSIGITTKKQSRLR